MTHKGFHFIDRTGLPFDQPQIQKPVIVSREDIEAEVERLAGLPAPANGRRMSIICNPASGVGSGFAPGTGIALCVLKPGERTAPIRHNSSQANFCIRGAGCAGINGKEIRYSQYDVWNTPSWAVYDHINDTSELQVRLTYSNAPLLEKMNVHIIDENPKASMAPGNGDHHMQPVNPFGTFEIGESGAFLMPYEKLINPDVAHQEALHWPWKEVKNELERLKSLGSSYTGRRLYLLYNPATERTNGTTNNFFATITIRPGNIVDRPHRHTAAAVNYFFAGRGFSVVDGERYEWKAGDLMLTAPGWAVHNHASYEDDVYELTIQDSPLNIWMGSLLWQENLHEPAEALGATGGFATNR
ncbi:MAG TPA: cupin domain-containing protein [Terriglobia bacterium]|nr:cupin domain-containing protein [Terriglobia bacterium]